MTTPKIACPFCGDYRSEVKNTRPETRTDGVRRRRQCLNPTCRKRFTTTEIVILPVNKLAPYNI